VQKGIWRLNERVPTVVPDRRCSAQVQASILDLEVACGVPAWSFGDGNILIGDRTCWAIQINLKQRPRHRMLPCCLTKAGNVGASYQRSCYMMSEDESSKKVQC
jgi:hypothetical protein